MGLFSAANKAPRKLKVTEGICSPSLLPSCDGFPLILLDVFVCSRVCALHLLFYWQVQNAKKIQVLKYYENGIKVEVS